MNKTGTASNQFGAPGGDPLSRASTKVRHAIGRHATDRLGKILVSKGALRPDQLAHAIEVQKSTGGPLGSVLVELGLVNEQVLAECLAEALGMEFLDLNKLGAIEPDAARVIPENIARRHVLVGVRFIQPAPDSREPTRLLVAMADPGDFTALDSVRAATGHE